MALQQVSGYVGKILRVDLSTGTTSVEALEEAFLRNYVGGGETVYSYC
jgi:aldehyde:ferredoxin oxidoreductase